MAYGSSTVAGGTTGALPDVAVGKDNTAIGEVQAVKKLDPTAGSTTPIGTDANPEKVKPRRRGTSDYDSGRVAVGDTLAAVTTATIFPESLLVTNMGDVQRWITVTDTAENHWVSQLPLAPRETRTIPFPPTSMVGVKMQASAAASVVAVLAGAQ